MSEVIEHAPADLTSPEMVLLLVLAEQARESTRQCWPGQDYLLARTRLSERALQRALAGLASRGLEVRVQIGTDRSGRPIFAHKGHQTTYLVPVLDTHKGRHPRHPLPEPKGDKIVETEAPKGDKNSSKGRHQCHPFPSEPSKQKQPTLSLASGSDPDPDVDRDLFGDPIEPPSAVPLVVAAYVDAVRAGGGIATSAMCAAIGKNAKRLLDVDKIHPAVVLVAAQRAGVRRTRTLDAFLGDAQTTYDRGGESRRAMFDHWQRVHDNALNNQRELGA